MITGTQNPIVGKEEFYRFTDGLDIFNSLNAKFVWSIWKKQKSGSWLNITQTPQKMGQEVPFKFGEKVIGEEFKLQVNKSTPKLFSDELDTKLVGEIIVVPTSSKFPKIDKVILFNGGAKDPNKASYEDTLVARAYCIAMFNKEVVFQLWEDDAPGPGHNANINKNNQLPQTFKGRVNEKGIAEVKISLLSNASILKAIANKYMMSADKDEGVNHEYYVTASYAGKIQKASQVNVDVVNPAHQPKPKDDSPKFPPTNDSKTKPQPDPKRNIKDAYFVNDKNQKLSSVQVNTHVKVQILSSNLIGKYIQYVVWEKDFGIHDEIYRSGKIKIPSDICTIYGFVITEKIFQKGIDLPINDPDSDKQNYFLEIIVLDSTAESKKFGLDDKAPQQMEVLKSPAKVDQTKTPLTTNCGEKYCIKKGDQSALIREINIRLAGFGGNVPTDKFTDRTEKMIKQFQRDYMKVPETGKVCGNTLRAIDEFSNKWAEQISTYKCLCHASDSKVKIADRCSGYGKGKNNEHPGIHRSLLWGVSALKFYLTSQTKYGYWRTSAGYRCWAHNNSIPRTSTNHMGKAVDIQFTEDKSQIAKKLEKNLKPLRNIRDSFYIKYLKAEEGWSIPSENNNYRLEPIGTGKDQSYSWIHMDVALFEAAYLKDEYFTKTQQPIINKSIVVLANELGYKNTCNCLSGTPNQVKPVESTNCLCFKQGKVKTACDGKGNLISEDLYEKESKRVGVEKAMMLSIAKQESKRESFYKEGQATILFERHKMWQYLSKDLNKSDAELKKLKTLDPLIVNDNSGGYGKYSAQYKKLEKAKKIDYNTALKSCSWGKFQVMGFNYAVAFTTPKEMEKAVNLCEIQQFYFFIGYLENTSGLINAMKNKNWELIAAKYNGSKWKTYNPDYATNIKKYYNEFKK